MDVSSGGHWTRARGIRQDAGKSREGKGFSQGFYFNEKGSNEKINEFHQQNYHKIDVVTTWGKNSHPGIIQFEEIFSAKLGGAAAMLQIPQAALLAGTFRKENGGDFAGAFADLRGRSVERPTSAPKGRPGRPSHRGAGARGPGGNTNAYEGVRRVGMGWKDLVIRKSPLGKFFKFSNHNIGRSACLRCISISCFFFLDDD